MISIGTLIWSIIVGLLVGLAIGYFLKDNYTKPDNQINVDLEVKKNRLFNRKKKIFGKKK